MTTAEPSGAELSGADPRRCSFVAIIGAPNAGKSTLVNALVRAKVSIVTHKVQTTRTRVRGVVIEGGAQLVFIDTPGIFRPRRKLDRAMVAAAWEGLEGADEVVLLVDAAAFDARSATAAARRAREDTERIVAGLKDRGGKAMLAINKVDLIDRPMLLAVANDLNGHFPFEETFYLGASREDGVDDFRSFLARRAPEGPWMYPEDQLTDISERLLSSEITREKLYLRLHDELPYESTVETIDWRRTAKGELRIEQAIYVSREGHKPIVLGKGGQTVKAVGEAARFELEKLFGEKVHLFLHVKVREKWTEESHRLREIGLDPRD